MKQISSFARHAATMMAAPVLATGIALSSLVIGDIAGANAQTTPGGQRIGMTTSEESTEGAPATGPAALMPNLGLAG